jgi:hypothetical protein
MSKLNEAGDFLATVKEAEFAESEKGTPSLALLFETEKGSIWGNMYLSDAAIERTVQALREAFNFDNNFDSLPTQVLNKQCNIVCEFEENEDGKEWLRVKWVNPVRKSKPLSNAAALLKQLSERAKRIPDRNRTAPTRTNNATKSYRPF